MIFFEPDISEADMQYNITQLEKTGSVKTFSQLYQEGLETTRSDSSSLLVGGYLFFCCFSGWHYQHDRAEYPAISAHVFRLLYLRLSLAKLRMDNSSISVVYVCRGGRCRTDFLAVYGDKGSAVLHADSAHRL